jgi:hypothetical protein
VAYRLASKPSPQLESHSVGFGNPIPIQAIHSTL